jgi:hypothetical protein
VKLLTVIILLAVAAGAAALTRPSEQSFRDHVTRQMNYQAEGMFARFGLRRQIDRTLAGTTYRRRLLWCEIERGGEVVSTGMFGHWLKRPEPRRGR